MLIFKALACDYDGTLASEDRLGPGAPPAPAEGPGAGVRGLLSFPATAVTRAPAPPPPPRFLAELDRRGVSYQLGRVIVGTARSAAGARGAAAPGGGGP